MTIGRSVCILHILRIKSRLSVDFNNAAEFSRIFLLLLSSSIANQFSLCLHSSRSRPLLAELRACCVVAHRAIGVSLLVLFFHRNSRRNYSEKTLECHNLWPIQVLFYIIMAIRELSGENKIKISKLIFICARFVYITFRHGKCQFVVTVDLSLENLLHRSCHVINESHLEIQSLLDHSTQPSSLSNIYELRTRLDFNPITLPAAGSFGYF